MSHSAKKKKRKKKNFTYTYETRTLILTKLPCVISMVSLEDSFRHRGKLKIRVDLIRLKEMKVTALFVEDNEAIENAGVH